MTAQPLYKVGQLFKREGTDIVYMVIDSKLVSKQWVYDLTIMSTPNKDHMYSKIHNIRETIISGNVVLIESDS